MQESQDSTVRPEGRVDADPKNGKPFGSSDVATRNSPVALSNTMMKGDDWKYRVAESLDPQVLFGRGYETFMENRPWCQPCDVDVLEILRFEAGDSISLMTKSFRMSEAQLHSWLKSSGILLDDEGQKASGGFRLIMGPSNPDISPRDLPVEFPHQMNGVINHRPLPFSRSILNVIVKEFHLPLATEWVFATNHSHFQRHAIYARKAPYIGYTMRKPTRGVLAMSIALSISHDPTTGMTNALLLGCSDTQQLFVLEQLKTLARLTHHPLLLPILLSVHQQQLLSREKHRLWVSLLQVETASGQTGAPAEGSYPSPDNSKDYDQITRDVLGVIQVSSAWESRTKELLLGLEAIEENMKHIDKLIAQPKRIILEDAENVFSEWLQYTTHKSGTLLCEFQYIEKRAQAQMTAVYNYIAQKDAQLSQKLSEYSTELAAESREISAASKRDSTAMKGIAVLTMVFLPGTFLATFFAMPIFDFTAASGPRVHEPGFWIYWTVTIPLTSVVLGAYIIYLLMVQRSHRKEDKEARENI